MASKRAKRRKLRKHMCENKKSYPDSQSAIKAKKYYYQHYKTKLNAYKCRFCGLWHLGHWQKNNDLQKKRDYFHFFPKKA